jgi:hypothetical protein
MRQTKTESWVVYRRSVTGKLPGGGMAVCERAEWDELEQNNPGLHTLVESGFSSEAAAEKAARGPDVPPPPRGSRVPKRSTITPAASV